MSEDYVQEKCTRRKPVTQDQLDKAMKLLEKGLTKRKAAEKIGISESVLGKRLKIPCASSFQGRFKSTFDVAQEKKFVHHCKKMDNLFFGVTFNDARRLAFEFAESNKISHPFDTAVRMAGRNWLDSFLARHNKLRIDRQSVSLARATGFNKIQVDKFYKNLGKLNEKYKFKPNRIYNMDEIDMSTFSKKIIPSKKKKVPKKNSKVVSSKKKKESKKKKVDAKLVSSESDITITVICCMSASGHFIPPAFIYPRKRPDTELLEDGPTDSICMVSDSAYINTNLILKWMHHFKKYAHPTKNDPVLLIIDNNSSHISLNAAQFARDNGIIMLILPPHSSHKIQPLDRSIFSSLKTIYAIECDKWMTQHPDRGVTEYQVARLFNIAYKQLATISNAESGFKVSGIYPFDDNLFDESDFAPVLITDQILQGNDDTTAELHQNLSAELPQNSSAELPQNLSAELNQNSSTELQQNSSTELHQNSSTELQQNSSTELQQNSSTELQQNLSATMAQLPQLYQDSSSEDS